MSARNPLDLLAPLGFELLRGEPIAPEADEDKAIAAARSAEMRRLAQRLRSSHAEERGDATYWLGRRLRWHERAPWIVTWGGRQTLAGLINKRAAALPDDATDLLTAAAPITGMSGLDAAHAADARDIGFSPDRLGMQIMSRVGAELLTIYALDHLDIATTPTDEWGVLIDGEWWRGACVRRGTYYRAWTTMRRARE